MILIYILPSEIEAKFFTLMSRSSQLLIYIWIKSVTFPAMSNGTRLPINYYRWCLIVYHNEWFRREKQEHFLCFVTWLLTICSTSTHISRQALSTWFFFYKSLIQLFICFFFLWARSWERNECKPISACSLIKSYSWDRSECVKLKVLSPSSNL